MQLFLLSFSFSCLIRLLRLSSNPFFFESFRPRVQDRTPLQVQRYFFVECPAAMKTPGLPLYVLGQDALDRVGKENAQLRTQLSGSLSEASAQEVRPLGHCDESAVRMRCNLPLTSYGCFSFAVVCCKHRARWVLLCSNLLLLQIGCVPKADPNSCLCS